MSTVLDGEQVWRTQPAWADVPDLELTARDGGPVDHLLVVVAHPDDETLAVGGLIHDAGRRGLRTTVLVASDGEASHPHSPTHSPADLAAIRRAELAAAMRTLNRRACCRRLGLGDGLLSGRVDTLTREISTRADAATLIVSTWRDTCSHCAVRRWTSRVNCSSVAPSAAVRTITPLDSGSTSLRMRFRRARSVSGSLREMPFIAPPGTYTR